MSMSDLILWGVPLAALIVALMRWAADLGLPASTAKHVKGMLFALGYVFVTMLPELEAAYPLLAEYGPLALGALVAYLTTAGYYEIQTLIRRALTRLGRIMKAC